MMFTKAENPLGLRGLACLEFAARPADNLPHLFADLGFSALEQHRSHDIVHFRQNDIHFLLNRSPSGFAAQFREAHGPSICGMGLRFENPQEAHAEAIRRGAKPFEARDGKSLEIDAPAVFGVGDSVIYFMAAEGKADDVLARDFSPLDQPVRVPEKGFLFIDHLTNNVHKGQLETWSDFYKDIFGFIDVRSFDIRGQKTGLLSYALSSPCGTFCIPINEGKEDKSQIEEYLREYHGAGIQHIALLSRDLLDSLDQMKKTDVEFLDIDPSYYREVFERVPNVTEDHARIEGHQALVDGDEEGYLLQIFTKNVIGPIFFEMIQRKNHASFGEGNFGALFRSIERDQDRRGVL